MFEHKWWINFKEATAKFGVLIKAGEISLFDEGLNRPKIAWNGDLKKLELNIRWWKNAYSIYLLNFKQKEP